jgi:hypothetical protein
LLRNTIRGGQGLNWAVEPYDDDDDDDECIIGLPVAKFAVTTFFL